MPFFRGQTGSRLGLGWSVRESRFEDSERYVIGMVAEPMGDCHSHLPYDSPQDPVSQGV
jgi:hypothetical protein